MDITIDGVTYHFDTAAITHRHEMVLWQQARLTLAECLEALGGGKPALFMLAALVLLARLAEGDDAATFDEIAEAINMGSDIDVAIITDDEVVAGAPEDPAAD
jgi:hypothetical protein